MVRRRRSGLNRARHAAAKTTVILGDLQAVKSGRIGQRLANRVIGRLVSKALRGIWR